MKAILHIIVGSAIYGFCAGSVDSWQRAAWNLAKFPALMLLTCMVCSGAYFALSLLITRKLSFWDVLAASLRTFGDLSMLLASLAPVSLFLARTIDQPTLTSLNEYPLFLGLNVLFIACAGVAALVRQTLRLVREHGLCVRKSVAVLLVWLAVSLFAGGQCAWYLRPFFGCSTIKNAPVVEGTNPDYRGARSFYEAVYQLLKPPPLPRDYYRHGESNQQQGAGK